MLIVSNQQLIAEETIVYRDCILAPLCYTATQDGKQVQGYGFMTVYMGLIVTAYYARPDEWLCSIEGAMAVGKAQIDLDCLALKHCKFECLR